MFISPANMAFVSISVWAICIFPNLLFCTDYKIWKSGAENRFAKAEKVFKYFSFFGPLALLAGIGAIEVIYGRRYLQFLNLS